MRPDYTIVIPVWGERYSNLLGEAIESVRRQAPEAPIVVIDNAGDVPLPGTESTHVVRLEDRVSVGRARNIGLAEVETEFALVLDADDTLEPGALEGLALPLRADPGLVAVVGRVVEEMAAGTGCRVARAAAGAGPAAVRNHQRELAALSGAGMRDVPGGGRARLRRLRGHARGRRL
ncbi:MAG: glycosyltransferase family A protein [Solirubrobacterales bacterium]